MATTLYGIKNCELFLVERPKLGVIIAFLITHD